MKRKPCGNCIHILPKTELKTRCNSGYILIRCLGISEYFRPEECIISDGKVLKITDNNA